MKKAPAIALLVGYAMLIATHAYYPKWQQSGTEATLSYDVSGYYLYLPALFIYDDLRELAFLPDIIDRYHPTYDPYQAFAHESGTMVMKYSAGQAVLYAPFFAVGHLYATVSEAYPADGFSRPYQVAISVGSLLVAFLGLYVMAVLLGRYFRPGTVAVTLLLLVFGTNYLNYAAIDGAMTHNHVFTLYALLLLVTDNLYRGKDRGVGTGGFLAIGAILGLMALTRPTEILAAVLPLFWLMPLHRDGLRQRLTFIGSQLPKVAVAAIACLAIGSLQLLYWHHVTGNWIVYSYQDQGFDWLSPHLIDGLFSYKAGWLTYTPLMWFAVWGFGALYAYQRQLFAAVALHTLLFIYVAFAWSVWWYGGSLGQRTMVQAYAVLAFPLAATVGWIWDRKFWIKGVFAAICLTFVAHNLWFTHQAHRGGLFVSEWMNRSYYWRTLFTFEKHPDDAFLLDNPDFYRGSPERIDTLYTNDFETQPTKLCGMDPIEGSGSVCLIDSLSSTPEFRIPGPFKWKEYIRATADFSTGEHRSGIHNSTQLVLRFYRNGQADKYRLIRIHRALNQDPNRSLTIEARVPYDGADEVAVLVWNGGDDKSAVLMDNLVVMKLE
ncbi:glycosyltransferase family protein [Neolewinella xylanilytica]|uniref:hypothetical protein n=1 Tax=Neolewinella xylanilytica TaxID=1514080 RepID=UPI000CEA8C2D|nr:hypothetical protein [Neolewinella xylanilytica]